MKLKQLINRIVKVPVNMEKLGFTDLAPVDNADPDGSYSKAITFALENPRIKNIALTGPYGSGKSSIIRTYEKNKNYKFLNISLASFKEEDSESPVDTVLIERSILQQMLYGADANKLPYSRFKRISTPTQPLFKASLLALWAIVTFFLYQHRNELLNVESFSSTWFVLVIFIDLTISLPIVLISDIYKASFGFSLKKISLTNAEIESPDCSENSILNRHLDEIIYFFQQTEYQVVVIEDLDRFGNPEIFVKLREINKLINDNVKTREIKFLYALKDDMFVHKNRAKFFDFIIPVVPIINSSNSLDKMQERLNEHNIAKSLNDQFFREVSLYMDDLRLIHNIFNEFKIYYDLLRSERLDATKLLAMMIYKNTYPNDFENLHHGKGALFEICKRKYEYLKASKAHLIEKINKLRASLEQAENEKIKSIRELIAIYIGYIVAQVNQPVSGLRLSNGQILAFSQVTTFDQFKPLISEQNIQLFNSYHQNVTSISKSFSQIEEEINPGEKFVNRKVLIENNLNSKKIELQQNIRQLEKEVSELPHKQLFELIQSNEIELNEIIKECTITDGKLLIYLVNNGYLDENYHLYISNFHEGRLTKIDRDYLLTIRNFIKPDPNQKIDTPKEVCINMRLEDFGDKYVLNVYLIDYLLDNKEIYSKNIDLALNYISLNFENSESFFSAYFNSGKNIADFICLLSQKWPELSLAAISSKHEAELICNILRFVDAGHISENMNAGNQLTDYLSKQGHLIFVSDLQLPDNYNVLKTLNVRFHDLISLKQNNDVIEFAHKHCLYEINAKNVNFVLQLFVDSKNSNAMNPEMANYTSILASGNEHLKNYVFENLPAYVENVFLALPDNLKESEAAIKALINNAMIDDSLKERIISKQNYIFKSFDEIPENLWQYLLLEEKVAISWKNISSYLSVEGNDKSVLTKLLSHQNNLDSLSDSKISKEELGENESLLLSRFIFNNNEINDKSYCKLIKCLPFSFKGFPEEISVEKAKCLAESSIVKLNEQTFGFADNDNQLIATLICKNFNTYLEEKNKYPISDNVRELILLSEINNEHKKIICLDVAEPGTKNSKQLSRLVANVLVSTDIDYSKMDDNVLSSAIINAQTITDSIQILMKCILKWDKTKTMEVLEALPEPFNEIPLYGKRTKLVYNKSNIAFAKLLVQKGFISSITEKNDLIIINKFKSDDHSV